MRRSRILSIALAALIAGLVLADDASAQSGRGTASASQGDPWAGGRKPLEFSAHYAHVWGGKLGSRLGDFRLATGDGYFLGLSVPIRPGLWGEISYMRQGTKMQLDRWPDDLVDLTNMSVNYWQIGAVQGLPRGRIMPYVIATLGMTHYGPDADRLDIDGTIYRLDSATKFSMTFGVGFKAVLDDQQRVGLRAQFRFLPTLYNTGAGLWFGSGGGGVSFGGSALWQYEVSGGLVVRLGG